MDRDELLNACKREILSLEEQGHMRAGHLLRLCLTEIDRQTNELNAAESCLDYCAWRARGAYAIDAARGYFSGKRPGSEGCI